MTKSTDVSILLTLPDVKRLQNAGFSIAQNTIDRDIIRKDTSTDSPKDINTGIPKKVEGVTLVDVGSKKPITSFDGVTLHTFNAQQIQEMQRLLKESSGSSGYVDDLRGRLNIAARCLGITPVAVVQEMQGARELQLAGR